MTKRPHTVRRDAQARILASAAILFGNFGYNGVSTRSIATDAGVNEVTIYRHYSRKRDLYVAVLDAELQQVRLRGDLLARIAGAGDAKTVLTRTFELIAETLTQKHDLVRLVQFSALELGDDIDPILRRHLGELVEVIAHYLEPWVIRGALRCSSAKALVLSLIGIIFSYESLFRIFQIDHSGLDAMFMAYANLTTFD